MYNMSYAGGGEYHGEMGNRVENRRDGKGVEILSSVDYERSPP